MHENQLVASFPQQGLADDAAGGRLHVRVNLLDLFGIGTTVAQEQVMQLGAALLSLLSTLGVVIDPTTPGVSDSQTVIERK